MADITITATSVAAGANSTTANGIAGAAITAGGICPRADLTGAGTYPTIVGLARSTTVLDVLFHESGASL